MIQQKKKEDINLSIMIQIKKKEDIHRFYHSRSSFNTSTFYFLYILVILLLNSTTQSTPIKSNIILTL